MKDSQDPPFDFAKINTDAMSPDRVSDELLLIYIKGIDFIAGNHGGWGVVAELAKRFADAKEIPHSINPHTAMKED